jgi:uncharacterized protein (DUF1810 family)
MELDLDQFLVAQERRYPEVVAELREGKKATHWMWFIFPQIAGLGRSPTAQAFAITSLDEAKAYLTHSVLGPRLRECTAITNAIERRSLTEIFGAVDAMKFRSSMTLFSQAAADNALFLAALDRYCEGQADERTLALLSA